jgi:hypothetical protein
MRKQILLLFVLASTVIYGQVKFSKEEIKRKNDSILVEANLLYQYEKVAWVSTDYAHELNEVNKKFGGYFIYQSGDTIKSIILDKKQENCIYDMSYINNFTTPTKELLVSRALNEKEKELISLKNKLTDQIFTPKYEISIVDGYSYNFQLIPYELGYKLYMISGTSKSDVIPFGNDYIFFADKNGIISSWRKFHSRLISMPTKYEGETVRGITHSHLVKEPFITATDICTFRLYGSISGIKMFKVLSTALSKVFTYELESNTIKVENL